MSRKWLDNLQYFATEEKTELEQWCTYIGYHKHKNNNQFRGLYE